MKYAKRLSIPHFRGVIMRNDLIRKWKSPWRCETGIINLDDSSGAGTHWVAYVKKDLQCQYFDSYGNLKPPKEFLDYMRLCNNNNNNDRMNSVSINYNYNNVQKNNTYNCGQLCLRFLTSVCNYLFISN